MSGINPRDLDAHIMGLHDPSAPFNQIDFIDMFEPVLDLCTWLTNELFESDEAKFEKLITDAAESVMTTEMSCKNVKLFAVEIANKAEQMYLESIS